MCIDEYSFSLYIVMLKLFFFFTILSTPFINFGLDIKKDTISILFAFDSSMLTDTLQKQIETQVRHLQKAADSIVAIELYGHCDFLGNHPYNDRLSDRRTNSIRQFLDWRLDIPDQSIKKVIGWGKRKPLSQFRSDEARALNRRVQMVVHYRKQGDKSPVLVVPEKVPVPDFVIDDSAKVGDKIILKNLNFYGGRHKLLPLSLPVLEELLRIMRNRPQLEIRIEGHICCRVPGVEGFDIDTRKYELSVNRAKTVYRYLLENGIDDHRISYKGFGSDFPLIKPELTEADRTTNRRVEIRIVNLH